MHIISAPHFDVRPKGQIQVIFGPMFSGKTTELIRRMKRYQVANHKCLIVKYARDTRYEATENLSTHDRQTLAATSATTLSPLIDSALNFSVIGIDEGQFFPDTVSFCEQMANAGKTVIVAALDGTYQRVGFGEILNLVPLAESVVKLNAVCMRCYGEASYTKRKGAQKEIEVIGGSDIYMAVCRSCYNAPPTPDKQAKKRTPMKDASSVDVDVSPAKKRILVGGPNEE